jgi:hypothetical protein
LRRARLHPRARRRGTAPNYDELSFSWRLITRARHQATLTGSARMCGRTRRCGSSKAPAQIATTSDVIASPRSVRCCVSSPIERPKHPAVTSTTPCQPPMSIVAPSSSSESHSWTIQCAPGIEWEKGSLVDNTQWASIHCRQQCAGRYRGSLRRLCSRGLVTEKANNPARSASEGINRRTLPGYRAREARRRSQGAGEGAGQAI